MTALPTDVRLRAIYCRPAKKSPISIAADRARYDRSRHGDTDEYCPTAEEQAAAAVRRAAAAILRQAPADSEEKHEPASNIGTVVLDSLKLLDPKWPIREADIDWLCMPT